MCAPQPDSPGEEDRRHDQSQPKPRGGEEPQWIDLCHPVADYDESGIEVTCHPGTEQVSEIG